ncbi:tRNA isopentenyltransferase, mitochondrial [Acromyrmex echinatior]|uniref:tRNA isopentenyltransferase, mitochondrial n=1 Tax=Acromyrmex echinatior TaxID=103372 RepID=F4X501_ACREC|nr:tRNA isopentenyltransferase, mitochondrial [Acromyrmex echinatior]
MIDALCASQRYDNAHRYPSPCLGQLKEIARRIDVGRPLVFRHCINVAEFAPAASPFRFPTANGESALIRQETLPNIVTVCLRHNGAKQSLRHAYTLYSMFAVGNIFKDISSVQSLQIWMNREKESRAVVRWNIAWNLRKILDNRLNDRVDGMMEVGLVQELLEFHRRYNEQRIKSNTYQMLDMTWAQPTVRILTCEVIFFNSIFPSTIASCYNVDILFYRVLVVLRVNQVVSPDYTKGIFQSIGFKEFHTYLILPEKERVSEKGKKLLQQGIDDLKLVTRRYAKRQDKWVMNRLIRRGDRQVPPVYSLDCTDVTKWDSRVLEPAAAIISAIMHDAKPEQQPLNENFENQKTTDSKNSNFSAISTTHLEQHETGRIFIRVGKLQAPEIIVCERVVVEEHQWQAHLEGGKHMKALKKKKKIAEDTHARNIQIAKSRQNTNTSSTILRLVLFSWLNDIIFSCYFNREYRSDPIDFGFVIHRKESIRSIRNGLIDYFRSPDYTKGIFQSIGFKEFHIYLILPEKERVSEKGKKLLQKGIDDLKLVTRRLHRCEKWDSRVLEPAAVIISAIMHDAKPEEQPLNENFENQKISDMLDSQTITLCKRYKNLIVKKHSNFSALSTTHREQHETGRIFIRVGKLQATEIIISGNCENQVCERVVVEEHQWQAHLEGGKYMKVLKKKKKIAEDIHSRNLSIKQVFITCLANSLLFDDISKSKVPNYLTQNASTILRLVLFSWLNDIIFSCYFNREYRSDPIDFGFVIHRKESIRSIRNGLIDYFRRLDLEIEKISFKVFLSDKFIAKA